MVILNCVGDGGCGNEFIARMYTSKISDEIEESYFLCPHCKKKFHIIYKNKLVRKIQDELKELKAEYDKVNNPKKAEKLFTQIIKQEKMLQEEMLRLEKEFNKQ